MVNSRQKGKRGELDLVKYLKSKGFEAKRGRQYKGTPDSPDIESNLPFHIECKFRERINVYEAYDKAVEDAGDKPAVVFYRKKNKPGFASLVREICYRKFHPARLRVNLLGSIELNCSLVGILLCKDFIERQYVGATARHAIMGAAWTRGPQEKQLLLEEINEL